MRLFLSFNDDIIQEFVCNEFFYKNGYFYYCTSDDDKYHKILISDLHYFNIIERRSSDE